jgi:hypothetical protein
MKTISEESKAKFRELLAHAGEVLMADGRLDDDDLAEIAIRGLPRLVRSLPGTSIGLAVPCAPGRSTVEETLSCVGKLAFDFGLHPLTQQSFEVANNRELLLDAFIAAGFRYLLFLDSDTVIEGKGVWQLKDTMERHRVAMVSALVPQRYTAGAGEYNAFLEGNEGEPLITVKREHIPSTLVPFPVKYCGLAAALLDLDKIKQFEGPRFVRVAKGHQHSGEDIFFCNWLTEKGLDFYVDPKVTTVHCVQHRFMYAPPTPGQQG